MTTAFRSRNVGDLQYRDNVLTNNFVENNTGPDGAIYTQLQLPDAMERYQEQTLHSKRPEKHIQQDDENGEMATRQKARYRMNLFEYGNERGDQNLAYKPEIVNDPVPRRTWDEDKYTQFQREKRIGQGYKMYGVAQKDDILQFPNSDPKFRQADTRKYIPGIIRTMDKLQIDDHLVPNRARGKMPKGVHQFKKTITDVFQPFVETTRQNEKKSTVRKKKGFVDLRQNIDNVSTNDGTKINDLYEILAKPKKTARPRLEQDIEKNKDESKLNPTFKKKYIPKRGDYINFGSIQDYLAVKETVEEINVKMKRNIPRPKLGFKTVLPDQIVEVVEQFKDKPAFKAKRQTDFTIGQLDETNDFNENVQIDETNPKKHKYGHRPTRFTVIHNEKAVGDDSTLNKDFKKQEKYSKKTQIRQLKYEILGHDDGVNDYELPRSKIIGKKDLSFQTVGHDLSEKLSTKDFGTRKYTPKYGQNITGLVETNYDDTVINEHHKEEYKSKKARVVRNMVDAGRFMDSEKQNDFSKPLFTQPKQDRRSKQKEEYLMRSQYA